MLQAGSAVLNNQQYFKDLLEVLHWDTVIKERNQSLPVLISLEQGGSWCYRIFFQGVMHTAEVPGRGKEVTESLQTTATPQVMLCFPSLSQAARRVSSFSPRHSPLPPAQHPTTHTGTGSRLHLMVSGRGNRAFKLPLAQTGVNNAATREQDYLKEGSAQFWVLPALIRANKLFLKHEDRKKKGWLCVIILKNCFNSLFNVNCAS